MRPHLVFVYGTLKRGEPNHFWMTDKVGKASFVARGETTVKYPLVIASRYNIPFLLDLPGTGELIKGEVYSIDDLKLEHLDVLEEYPTLYTRRLEQIKLEDDESGSTKVVEAYSYFLIKHKAEMLQLEFISNYSSLGAHGKVYSFNDDLKDPEDIYEHLESMQDK